MRNHDYIDDQSTAWRVGRLFEFLLPKSYQRPTGSVGSSVLDGWRGTEGVGAGEESVPSSWPRLLRYCAKNNVDPIDYVRRSMGNLEAILDPSQLFERRLLDVYRVDVAKAPYRICLKGRLDAGTMVNGIRSFQLLQGCAEEGAIVLAVTDPHSGVRPLMRYCVARKRETKRLLRLAESYLTGAVIQYQEDQQLYDRYWGQLLPPGFPTQANEIYEHLVGWDRNPFIRKRSKSRG